ncbi:MAG: NHL repeat-containing protein [Pirellulaceae bacterium]
MTRLLIQWTVVSCAFVAQSVQAADQTPGRTAPRAIILPDYCNTPDAMAVLADDNMILSVPNFTDPTYPGVLMKIAPNDEVSLFCKLPPLPQTGHVFPMGIRQSPSGDIFVADCQFLDEIPNNSRLLCVRVVDGKPNQVEVVAQGLNIANGVAIHAGFVYVTDSSMSTNDDGTVISGVYRFRLDEREIQVKPGGNDPHLVATLKTVSQEIPVGADGIDFDEQGHLYVANCGDAIIEKLVLSNTGQVVRRTPLTAAGQMRSADGIFYDRRKRRIYVADILANAIRAVDLDGRVETVAENGDTDGSAGQLDAPSEAVVRRGELIAANFDRVFPGSVNTQSNTPHTLAVMPIADGN